MKEKGILKDTIDYEDYTENVAYFTPEEEKKLGIYNKRKACCCKNKQCNIKNQGISFVIDGKNDKGLSCCSGCSGCCKR